MSRWRVAGAALLLAACAPPAPPGSPSAPRFYTGKSYGSEAEFNPLTEIVNEGFDITQTNDHDRHVFRLPYAVAARNVWQSVVHADRTFRWYGYSRALQNEWLPITAPDNTGGGAWVPNYEYHLIGSGMVSIRMSEWFAQHGVTHPGLAAAATIMSAHYLNEIVENGSSTSPNEDATTDLLIFDIGGLALWQVDAVQRLFSGALQFTNWPGQPSIDIASGTIQNVGQQFVLRAPLPYTSHWKVMYDFGMSTLLGLSRTVGNGDAVSIGVGTDAVANPIVDARTGARGATLQFKGGVFYDRNGSLLGSIQFGSRLNDAAVNVNLYPGVLHIGGVSPGVWLQMPRTGGVRLGVASRWGFGLGHGPER
jgi:hypothetical protein